MPEEVDRAVRTTQSHSLHDNFIFNFCVHCPRFIIIIISSSSSGSSSGMITIIIIIIIIILDISIQ